jgi:RNA polymerase sigma-B factor
MITDFKSRQSIALDRHTDAELISMVQARPKHDRLREAAYEELVNRYAVLVRTSAMRYSHSPEPVEELIQVGYLGLLNAINNYDPAAGNSLEAYARPCVSGELKRHFRDKRWQIRVRRRAQELRAEIRSAESELAQQLFRQPTAAEIAAYLEISEEEVLEGKEADHVFQALSLDAPLSDQDSATLADALGEYDADMEAALGRDSVWTYVAELPAREQEMLAMRFYGNMTQAEIGQRLNLSQMHVSRLLGRALGYLRDRMGEHADTA